MILLAFFGTGSCDPSKDIKTMGSALGILLAITLTVALLRRIIHSKSSSWLKSLLIVLLMLSFLGVVASIALYVFIGLACSG